MKIEELHIGQRVRINDGQDWNDNQHGTIYSLEKRRDGRENIGVKTDDDMMFDGFTAENLHAPFPEMPLNAELSGGRPQNGPPAKAETDAHIGRPLQ
jgi:hypothetical protein